MKNRKFLLIFSLILSLFVVSCSKKEETTWDKFIATQKGGKSVYGEPKEFKLDFEPKIDLDKKIIDGDTEKTVKELIEEGDVVRNNIFKGILPRHRRKSLMDAYEKSAEILVPLLPIDDEDIKPIAVYNVENGEIVLKSGELNDADKKISMEAYKNFSKLFPNKWIENIKTMEVNRDNKNMYAAYISRDEETGDTKLGINLVEGYFSSNSESANIVYIHEFAHAFSQKKDQVDFEKEFEIINLSSYKENSYIRAFNDAFWKNVPETWRYNSVKEQKDADDFYRMNKDNFISPYSSVNVMEDFAESFVSFVIEDNTLESNWIFDKKLNFFYQYPELVLLRLQILRNFK